jgi:chitin disaccharide deacetylase
MVRRLIVNADDFGLTSGINRAIIEAHRNGIVTSSTLMAGGPKFREAVALAAQTPNLSVGCHVLLVDASPMLGRAEVSSLAAPSRGKTRFRSSLASFACLAVARRLDENQIEAEILAQIAQLQSAGIQVSHLDSHKHTHLFPVVFKPMIRAAKKCGVRAIRNPFEPLLFASIRNWKRSFQLGILRSFRARLRDALNEAGILTPDGCVGIVATGALNLERVCALLENLPEGTWEFVTHPGYNDAELATVQTRLRFSREKEREVLTSAEVKEILHRERIQLISYHDFAAAGKSSPEVPSPLSAGKTNG